MIIRRIKNKLYLPKKSPKIESRVVSIDNEKVLKECKKQARNLISKFPLYPEGYFED